MSKVNFVPDDYLQKKETKRANMMYIVLFVVIMFVLGSTFGMIKVRQKVAQASEDAVDAKILKAGEDIKQLEILQSKRKVMMQAALTTAGLIEPLPRSVILASLTNSLPQNVSLTNVKLFQQESYVYGGTSSKYSNSKGKTSNSMQVIKEDVLQVEGISPSDIEVASLIADLGCQRIFENVELSQSKEKKINGIAYRDFNLNAKIRKDYSVTDEDVKDIVSEADNKVAIDF